VRELDPTIADDDQAILAYAAEHKEVVAVRVGARIRLTADQDHIPMQFRRIFVRIGACE
jgi:putative ATP-dependent endonuclease of OLD family